MRFGAFESVAELDQIGDDSFGQSAVDLCRRKAVVPNHKRDVAHVLRIVASHHFSEDEIERRRPEQSQPPGWWLGNRNQMLFPSVTEEDLIGSEKMRDIKAHW